MGIKNYVVKCIHNLEKGAHAFEQAGPGVVLNYKCGGLLSVVYELTEVLEEIDKLTTPDMGAVDVKEADYRRGYDNALAKVRAVLAGLHTKQ